MNGKNKALCKKQNINKMYNLDGLLTKKTPITVQMKTIAAVQNRNA